jgi:hypothetical protein
MCANVIIVRKYQVYLIHSCFSFYLERKTPELFIHFFIELD